MRSLLPETAWAWTPGTHVFLGEAVLRSLALLPGGIAELLRAERLAQAGYTSPE